MSFPEHFQSPFTVYQIDPRCTRSDAGKPRDKGALRTVRVVYVLLRPLRGLPGPPLPVLVRSGHVVERVTVESCTLRETRDTGTYSSSPCAVTEDVSGGFVTQYSGLQTTVNPVTPTAPRKVSGTSELPGLKSDLRTLRPPFTHRGRYERTNTLYPSRWT